MMPTGVLREEHRVILHALDLLERAADRLDRGAPLPDGWLADLVAWLRGFADRNHHAKEETALFPAMVKAGVPSMGGPIGVMLEEHERGRALLHGLATGDPSARAAAAHEYVGMLREHIDKENGVLFPLADAVLDEAAQRGIGRELESVEAQQGREASIAHAEAVVERLQAALEAR
ncbi:MAG TPA: hemerythrin domain-containing protein [Candidatus Bathyarchaeia archaeon]|nr:hemerythrin domain-containing protein [Candidatus Bathyarchaeia archaeon]